MKKTLLIIILLACITLSFTAIAQSHLPVIRAGSPAVSIRDGGHLDRNSWHLEPKAKPDIYYTQVPEGNRRITFITDRDSISFSPGYGEHCDFVILLNGKDSCLTRISAAYTDRVTYTRVSGRQGNRDTIPFTLKDNRIYFKGSLNGRPGFSIMFDLGAGITGLNAASAGRSGASFDGQLQLHNTDGTNTAPSSSANKLEIAGLRWMGLPLVQVRNLDDADDLIVGNGLFRDKVLEIDYVKKLLIVSDSLPQDLRGYSRFDLAYFQQRPFFRTRLRTGGGYEPFYFLFDTGRDGTMLIGRELSAQAGLYDRLQTVLPLGSKKLVRIPDLRIGSLSFPDIITKANSPGSADPKQSLIGNQVLIRFNAVLDNVHGVLYLKPNGLQSDYATYSAFRLQAILMISGVLLLVTLCFLVFRRRWRKRRQLADRGK